jgi:hypothetical protein
MYLDFLPNVCPYLAVKRREEREVREGAFGEGVRGEGRSAWRRQAGPVHRLNAGEGHNAEFLNAES